MKITRVSIDLGKSAFHVHAVGRDGKVVMEKRFSRRALVRFLGEVEPCLVGLEACGGAHHWARVLRDLGHDARLMSPQFVKPYVKSNKNDVNDADAIAEASTRPGMRYVEVKSVAQQDLQHLHRIRSQAVSQRTALANQARSFLLEYGIVIAKGIGHLRRRLPEVLEDADSRSEPEHAGVPAPGVYSGHRAASLDRVGGGSRGRFGLSQWTRACGLGRRGPRQHSTGGRTVLLGISKRGDRYLRSLLIHGARAALRTAPRRADRSSRWALEVQQRRGTNVATVALANKILRTAWALLTQEVDYAAKAG